jgi:hypothetical protein
MFRNAVNTDSNNGCETPADDQSTDSSEYTPGILRYNGLTSPRVLPSGEYFVS